MAMEGVGEYGRVKKKTTLLFCIESLRGGGAEKVLLDLLRRIDRELFSITLFVIADEGVYFEKIPKDIIWFTAKTAKSTLKPEYDIEIAFLEGLATKYIACRKNHARKMAWVHTDLSKNQWWRRPFKNEREVWICYQQMDRIIFVSEISKERFFNLFPPVRGELIVLHNLIDKEEIRQKANASVLPKQKMTVCSVGSLNLMKGYAFLLPVLHRLVREGSDFQYWILGEGCLRNKLLELINELELNDHVFLKGFQENPYPFIKAADIFVSCSYVEGFSLVICEALCLGRPVLSTRSGGPEEILASGKYGVLVDMDADSLYQGIKTLLSDNRLREHYATMAEVRAELFDASRTMVQLHSLWLD